MPRVSVRLRPLGGRTRQGNRLPDAAWRLAHAILEAKALGMTVVEVVIRMEVPEGMEKRLLQPWLKQAKKRHWFRAYWEGNGQ